MQDHRFYYDVIQYNGNNKLKRLYKDHTGRFTWEEIGLITRMAACKELYRLRKSLNKAKRRTK